MNNRKSHKSNIDKQKIKNKIDVRILNELYNEGKSFEIKPEEIEHLLNKCEEFFDFYKECELIKNQNLKPVPEGSPKYDPVKRIRQLDENYQCNYQKLIALRKKMSLYNIKCDVFDFIDSQINLIQKWMEDYIEFQAKMNPS